MLLRLNGLTNVASTIITLVGMTPPSPFTKHVEKLEKFNGLGFTKRYHKILLYLTTLNLTKFLIEEVPKL